MVQVFNRDAMQQIADVVRRVLGEPGTGGTGGPSGLQGHCGLLIFVVKVGTAIAAASGTTPGSGTVTVYEMPSSTLAVHNDANSTAVTKTAYNLHGVEIPANTYQLVAQDQVSGKLWIIFAEGSPPEPEIAYATLSQKMTTATTSPTVTAVVDSDGTAVSISNADNDYDLAGVSGDTVVLARKKVGEAVGWVIVNVLHKARKIVLDDPSEGKGALKFEECAIHAFLLDDVPVMSDVDPAWESQISLEEQTAITDIQIADHELQAKTATHCWFETSAPDWEVKYTFDYDEVVTNARVRMNEDNCVLELYHKNLYTLGSDEGDWNTDAPAHTFSKILVLEAISLSGGYITGDVTYVFSACAEVESVSVNMISVGPCP
jgi:hypothetical protein